MARSVWKGPFVELSLLKKAQEAQEANSTKPIKTWSRRSTILPDFIGVGIGDGEITTSHGIEVEKL